VQLVFIHGPAAAGKLTIARVLGVKTGFPVFHNHLVADMLLAVFDFGSPPFVYLRENIWLEVTRRAGQERLPGLILTFTPERTVRPEFIGTMVAAVENAGGRVLFVQLTCPGNELERRTVLVPSESYPILTGFLRWPYKEGLGQGGLPRVMGGSKSRDNSARRRGGL